MPVVNFAAGGVATPADAALMMQLGVDGVFVGSGDSRAVTRLTRRRDRQSSDPLSGREHPRGSKQGSRRADGRTQYLANAGS